ncbi:MAG: hypothetical protein ACRD5G_09975 [Candidatus Acidiferrales bacterium]
MPVYKFRSLDEMRRAQWLRPDDPRLPLVIRLVWHRAWEMAGSYVPPRGLFKFRSMEEANAHRTAWEDDRIARIQRHRAKPSRPVSADDAETRE